MSDRVWHVGPLFVHFHRQGWRIRKGRSRRVYRVAWWRENTMPNSMDICPRFGAHRSYAADAWNDFGRPKRITVTVDPRGCGRSPGDQQAPGRGGEVEP
jgi:hypothetical protein